MEKELKAVTEKISMLGAKYKLPGKNNIELLDEIEDHVRKSKAQIMEEVTRDQKRLEKDRQEKEHFMI